MADTGYARGYHYDEFGNLSVQSNTNVPLSSVTPFYNGSANPYNAATNHIVTVDANNGYDGRGNITKLAVNTVTMGYDAESNMTSTVDTGTGQNISWVYDAEGRRAQKSISGGSWTLYIHDAFGQLAASYNNNGVTPDCTTCYLTYDMVGTPRLITDQNENVVARHDFIPFGEEIQNGVAERNGNFGFTSNVTQAFTAQESDGGTVQLDYFNARHLSAVLGGFVQPDPMSAGADITRPQSWNAYAYVLGNPLGLVDPSGMDEAPIPTTCSACTVTVDGGSPDPVDTEPTSVFTYYYGDVFGSTSYGVGNRSPAPVATPPNLRLSTPAAKNVNCGKPIMQPTYTKIYSQMGKDLNVKPIFIMTTSLQESGWDLVHVYGTNKLSHGLPLNHLFGMTQAGRDNIPYPNPAASAADWERVWGPQLKDNPQTIQAYVQDLLKVPAHRYNAHPGYAKQMYATYSTLVRTVNNCGTTF